MIVKHLRATIGLLTGIALLVAACGAPQQGISVRNVTDATAGAEHPTTVAQATERATAAATAAPTQAGGAATQAPTQVAPTMAGMDMSTPVPVTRAAATTAAAGAATAESTGDFVVGWLLYGTPTGSPAAPGAATAGAAAAATQAANAATAAATGDFVVGELLFGTATPRGSAPGGGAATTVATVATTAAPATQAAAATTAVSPTAVAAAATATKPAGTASPSGGAPAAGSPARGQQIFNGKGTCSSCHDIASGVTIVGPTFKGLVAKAGTRKPGMSAHDYLYESIVKPNVFVVQGFQSGLMPQNFAQMLSAQEIEDVIAYLMTLK
ncbi:MAG: cytochrome c [Anaerolineae bacterium]|nr:cytochrome c [Anaerolineae bacterium]